MIRTYQVSVLLICLIVSTFAQDNFELNDLDNLSKQVSPAKTITELREIASEAEKIYSINKKKIRNNQEALAKTNVDFALLRRDISQSLLKILFTPGNSDDELRIFHKLYKDNFRKWEFKPFIYEGKAMKMKGIVYYYDL